MFSCRLLSLWCRLTVFCWFQLAVIIVSCCWGSGVPSNDPQCPRTCFCNPISRIVYCSRRGLDSVPTTLPNSTLQLNLNGNRFKSRALQTVNFSLPHISTVEHLYLSDCGIETIEVDTFSQLSRLRWLDLSDNKLRVVPARTFHGLTLQHLFLNGNRDIRLLPASFDGLVVSGLYLHDCGLEQLDPDTLSPLNGTLVNLWLNANRLATVDRRLASLFSALSHLRLGSNPLHCNCDAVWLKELYDRQGGATFRGAEPPTCWSPGRLRSRHFDELSVTDLRCRAPSFGNIDALLDSDGGRLRCSAVGEPAPTLYWIRPSGRTVRYDAAQLPDEQQSTAAGTADVDGHNEGVLTLASATDAVMSGMYICVAKNEVGNVTLTVNISWPPSRRHVDDLSGTSPSSLSSVGQLSRSHRVVESMLLPAPSSSSISSTSVSSLAVINIQDTHSTYIQHSSESETHYEPEPEVVARVAEAVRLFTVSEMAIAVVGTHLATLLLFMLIVLPVYRVRAVRAQRRHHTQLEPETVQCRDALLLGTSSPKTPVMTSLSRDYRITARSQRWAAADYDVT